MKGEAGVITTWVKVSAPVLVNLAEVGEEVSLETISSTRLFSGPHQTDRADCEPMGHKPWGHPGAHGDDAEFGIWRSEGWWRTRGQLYPLLIGRPHEKWGMGLGL